MSDQRYPVEPMAAFYAAVTAVEEGKVGEVELDFNFSSEDGQRYISASIIVRKKAKPQILAIAPRHQGEDTDD